ncbi:MAG: hypothetical protein K6F72_05965 [Bacteroidales bacterium]|nr:hypothetical protein [Bacteroidales bacterium]
MRKRLLIIMAMLLATASVSAQRFVRGFALGADRDTLQYIIASPFDNWFITPSVGIQTFIGNTPDKAAAWNKLDFGARVEVGKWIIPDVAVSLRLGLATAHSKSRHGGNNPWTDISNPINYDGQKYGPYYPISAYNLSMMGIVTFDWTNFLNGYEAGKRRHLHFYTPVGLGVMMMYGKIVNPNYVNKVNHNDDEIKVEMGQTQRNFELGFTGGLMTEYYATKHLSIYAAAELAFARGSIDDYNYNLDDGIRRSDFMPSIYVGVKFNLLKSVSKYNPYTKSTSRERVNHEFLAFGTRNTVSTLQGRIERLNNQIDSVQNLSDAKSAENMVMLTEMGKERDSLQQRLDSIETFVGRPPANVIEELLNANEELGLPATVVYYQLDKFDIDYNGLKKLQKFAKELNQLDDTLEYYVIGAADSITGSIPHNQWLSERRCEAAYNMLVKDFGVSANQLILMPVGGIMEYTPQENNRMALIILRTPQTEAIVTKWMEKYKYLRK